MEKEKNIYVDEKIKIKSDETNIKKKKMKLKHKIANYNLKRFNVALKELQVLKKDLIKKNISLEKDILFSKDQLKDLEKEKRKNDKEKIRINNLISEILSKIKKEKEKS